MFPLCLILLLGVASVGRSSSLPCKDLVRPLDQLYPDLFVGRWPFVAIGLSDPIHAMIFKTQESAGVVFVNGTSGMHLTRNVKFADKCEYSRSELTPVGGGFNLTMSNHTLSVLRTSCPDCLVIHSASSSGHYRHVYLFSRRREVKKEEMEEFESQVKCLNFSHVVQADPTKELCPDEI